MSSSPLISTDRQAREISATVAELNHVLSSEQVLKSIVEGLPRQVVDGLHRSLATERRELQDQLKAYDSAKQGDLGLLRQRAGTDPGALLVVARIMRGWSQKDLARKLGQREQAIQRYEAEKYRSISLAGLLRVARALGIRLSADLSESSEDTWTPTYEVARTEAQKILKHARANGWLENDADSDENAISQLTRYIAEHVGEYGTPSLLRTGLNVEDHSEDWALLSWKAQVTRRAKAIIQTHKLRYRPLDIAWLKDLVRLSRLDDGPIRACDLLLEHKIVMIVEPHIPGMKVDGAAFLVDDVPVIGVTVLRDTLDNFWFTLLHEVAHVILHYRTGLASGFFDDIETSHVDEFEEEANSFAGNMLIPDDIWSRSPARIAKSAEPIEHLANRLGIAPAIIFGRIRMERRNYSLFADNIGRGKVRKQLLPQHQEELPSNAHDL